MHREIGTMNFSSGQTERIVTPVTGLVHEDKKNSVCFVRGPSSEVYTDAGALVRLTLYTTVYGMVRPLLGSRRKCQAMLHLFQKREEIKPTRCNNIDDLLSIVDVDY